MGQQYHSFIILFCTERRYVGIVLKKKHLRVNKSKLPVPICINQNIYNRNISFKYYFESHLIYK